MTLFKYEKTIGYLCVTGPIIGYWLYWTLHPSYWFNGDPAAYYMLDSLSVFIGKSYVYVDHPGTPMQIIGTLMLALTYPFFESTKAFVHFYITKPVAFFLMAHAFLLVSNIFAAGVFCNTAYSTLKRHRFIGAIALVLAYFILHPQSFQSLTLWSHNSLNFPFGTLWLVWVYRELRQEKELKSTKLMLLGFAVGTLAIAQVYFFAWVVSGIVIVFIYSAQISRSYKVAISASLIYLLGSLAGITFMLIPIYRELPRFAGWLIQIITHKGLYGTGEAEIYSFETISIAINFWWASIRLMTILIFATFIAIGLLANRMRKLSTHIPPSSYAMVIGLSLQMGLLLLLFSKAALKLRYTLALAAVLPVLLLLTINLFELVRWRYAQWIGVFYAAILIGVAFALPRQISLAQERFYYEEDVLNAKAKVVDRLAKELGVAKDNVIVVLAYGTPLKCTGMLEASAWTGYFKDEISAICPSQYAIFDTDVELNSAQPLKDIRDIDWDLVIWPGNGSDLPEYLESVGAINIPQSWRIHRSRWYFIHANTIK